jgi:uncharacterized protein (TIGR00369 family)
MKEKILPRYKNCFVCGTENAYGLKLCFKTDSKTVWTKTKLDKKYVGYVDCIHGGILSCILDEAMCWACIEKKDKFFYTTEMSLKYLRPVKPDVEITVEARIVSEDNGIMSTEAELRNDRNKICVKAKAKFYPAKDEDNQKLLNS